jgi:hypothetical protein
MNDPWFIKVGRIMVDETLTEHLADQSIEKEGDWYVLLWGIDVGADSIEFRQRASAEET